MPRRGGAVIACLCFGHFLAFFDRYLFAVTAPLAARDLDLNDLQLGVLLGPAFAVVYGFAAVLLGLSLRHRTWAGILIAGLALWTAASVAVGVAPGFATLVLARMAVAVGQAAFVPTALTTLVGAAVAARARALGWFTGAATLGRCTALLGGGALLGLLSTHMAGAVAVPGWRLLYVATALPNLLLIALFVVLRPRAACVERVEERAAVWPWLAANAGAVALATVTAISSVAATQTIASWLPLLLVRLHGMSASHAAMIVGGLTLAGAPAGQVLASVAMDRSAACRGRPAAVNFAGLLGVVAGVALVVLGRGLAAAVAGIAIAELAAGVAVYAGLFGFQAIVPTGVRGPVNALFLAATTLVGAGLGPLLVGLLSYSDLLRGIGGALLATTGLCALVALVGVRRPQHRGVAAA